MYSHRTITLPIPLFLIFIASPAGSAQTGKAPAKEAPPPIYVDEGACPFECCTYRAWTVRKSTTVFDRPNGKGVVAVLAKGARVTGLTGEVISEPVAVKAGRDIPDTPIKAGDTFYVLHYDGEGVWEAWFRGKKTQVDQSVIAVPRPKSSWWVKIKDSRGRVGWALSQNNFGNQDACG